MQVRRGDIWLANLGEPGEGSIQSGRRPVVIIQNDLGNRHSRTVIVAPLTSKKKRSLPTHVSFEGSTILLEQIRTINKTDLVRFLDELPEWTMGEINRSIEISLGLRPVGSRTRQSW